MVVDEKALSGKAFRNISKRILGEEVSLLNLDENQEGKLSKALKLLFGR